MIIDYDKLLDTIEVIQGKAYLENKGTNEEQLQVRIDVIEHLKTLVNNYGALDSGVVSSSNICTDTNEECKHNCSGLCKERC